MTDSVPAASRRLTTEAVLDAAMEAVRGRDGGPSAEAHERLVKAARAFALAADPRGKSAGLWGGCDAKATVEGLRVVVSLSRGGAQVTVSGPRREAILWSLDSIEATEDEAISMLEDAARDWPRGT